MSRSVDLSDVRISQLCVPDDNLEDLEFFPNFSDDFIHITGLRLEEEEDKFFNGDDCLRFLDTIPEPEPETQDSLLYFGVNSRDGFLHEPETEPEPETQDSLLYFGVNSRDGFLHEPEPEQMVSRSYFGGKRILLNEPKPEQEPPVSRSSIKGQKSVSQDDDFSGRRKTKKQFLSEPEFKLEPLVSRDYFEGNGIVINAPNPERKPLVPINSLRGKEAVSYDDDFSERKMFKKQSVSDVLPSPTRRRCSHCETEKTRQWRIGPNGPKSLCNACGIRYNSGRLVPEYRPAASPTFDSRKHSNFHRKIIKKQFCEL